MEAELADIMRQLDSVDAASKRVVDGLAREQLLWRPGATKWSITECFDHLVIVDGMDLPGFRSAAAEARKEGATLKGPFRYGVLSGWFVSAMEPPVRRFKASSSGPYVPRAELDPSAVIQRFFAVHEELRAFIVEADGVDLARVKVRSPVGPAGLKMSLGRRLQLIAAHDRRHVWQAEQVTRALP
jgi:hypothetical protein